MNRPIAEIKADYGRRLVKLQDAAVYAGGCNPRTIRRMVAAGELTGYRLRGRLLLIDLNELDDVMRVVPTAG